MDFGRVGYERHSRRESVENNAAITENSSSDEDVESSAEEAEERMRKLFQSCDTDGDGYITSHDLAVMCHQLNMEEDSVEEILEQLGADQNGRISYEEFACCQMKMMNEAAVYEPSPPPQSHCNNQSVAPMDPSRMTSWPTGSDNSLGAGSSGLKESSSWEYDSGARDLSPEPNSLQKLVENAATTGNGSTNFLELANTLHLAALASLKGEIIELNNRLQHVTNDRDVLEKKLAKSQVERVKLIRLYEDRSDQQATRYEERMVELHSVIAELNKKIERTQTNIIREEDEYSQSASSPPSNLSGGSCAGSSHSENLVTVPQNGVKAFGGGGGGGDLSAELSRVVGELEQAMDIRRQEDSYKLDVSVDHERVVELQSASHNLERQTLQVMEEVESLHFEAANSDDEESYEQGGYQPQQQQQQFNRSEDLVQQELNILREENENLNSSLSQMEEEMDRAKSSILALREERDKLRRKTKELQTRMQSLEVTSSLPAKRAVVSPIPTQAVQPGSGGGGAKPPPIPPRGIRSANPSNGGEMSGATSSSDIRGETPVAKMAERVKLKQARTDTSKAGNTSVTGSDINSVGITNAKIAEHLVHSLQDSSNVQEIFHSQGGSNISEGKVREFEVEMERLNSKIEHLKSQNDVLQLTLGESKANCDRLAELVGKYESNNTALQMAVNYTEQGLEACESLLGLVASEREMLVATCRAAGLTGIDFSSVTEESEDLTGMLKRVHQNRRLAENLAKSVVQKLDRSCGLVPSGCHVPGCHIQPWEDLSSHSHTSTTSSTASSCDTEFTKDDEQRLRDYIRQLKNDRAAVKLTVLELESVHVDPLSHDITSHIDSQRLDLENAVLMQELTAVKEEKAELKAQNYLLEKERKTLELRLTSRDAQEEAFRVHIEHLKSEVEEQQQNQQARLNRMQPAPMQPKEYQPGLGGVGGEGKVTPAITLAQLSQLDDPSIPADLADGLRREKKLKVRIQELVATLENLQRSSEQRHQQSAEFVADLKRANSALVSAFEKAKKKHQSRLKKLEAQMMAMVERHETQARMLKQRIALLEEESAVNFRPLHNETSL